MTTATFQAMGTSVVVHADGQRGLERSRSAFERYEQRFSRFRPTSELSRINNAGEHPTRVSDEMRGLLELAQEIHRKTNQLVDIGVGAAVRDWGYHTTFSDVSDVDRRPTLPSPAAWQMEGGVVRLMGGSRLDLGGIAKGWSCDRVVEARHANVVSAGGDVRSVDPSLIVEVLDDKGDLAAEVHLGIGALATSSRAKRHWLVDGDEEHHIIDPRTMRPAVTPVVSATVIAETAVEAEAGAKAVLILGADGLKWADSQPWIRSTIVVWHDGNVYGHSLKRAS